LTWMACLGCAYFRGLSTSGLVDCEVYGETEPKLLCKFLAPLRRGAKGLPRQGEER